MKIKKSTVVRIVIVWAVLFGFSYIQRAFKGDLPPIGILLIVYPCLVIGFSGITIVASVIFELIGNAISKKVKPSPGHQDYVQPETEIPNKETIE